MFRGTGVAVRAEFEINLAGGKPVMRDVRWRGEKSIHSKEFFGDPSHGDQIESFRKLITTTS